MKKKFICPAITMLFALAFIGCGSDDENGNEVATPPVVKYSPVGVWESGNYFLSLSSDNFYTAYVADKFIDCGNYTVSNESVVTCQNTFFARSTTYTIKNLSDTEMQVEVSYTDIEGNQKKKSLSLTKTDKTPAIKENPLVGKSSFLWFSQSTSDKVTYTFSSYNTGSKTTTQVNAKKWPMTLFYIYANGKLYYQQFNQKTGQVPQIKGWNDNVGTGEITVWTMNIQSDGTVEFGSLVTNTSL